MRNFVIASNVKDDELKPICEETGKSAICIALNKLKDNYILNAGCSPDNIGLRIYFLKKDYFTKENVQVERQWIELDLPTCSFIADTWTDLLISDKYPEYKLNILSVIHKRNEKKIQVKYSINDSDTLFRITSTNETGVIIIDDLFTLAYGCFLSFIFTTISALVTNLDIKREDIRITRSEMSSIHLGDDTLLQIPEKILNALIILNYLDEGMITHASK